MSGLETLQALVVDDHPSMRTLLVRVLRTAGMASVREAENGAQALRLLAETPADLILADSRMPEMDGATFIRAVRAEPMWATARILMLTGDPEAEAARADGADAVLIKPAAPSEILAAVAQLLAYPGPRSDRAP